jgi:co-chaperonin GroES (HSP10)
MTDEESKVPGTPVLDNILVQVDAPTTETEAGVVLPAESEIGRPKAGTVVALGPKVKEECPEIQVGTRLSWLYPLSSTMEYDDLPYLLLTPHDIALILEP